MNETKHITFTLDGKTVEARPGETVLTIAKRMKIEIPSLCHHEAITPYGSCRLCVVEVKKGKRTRVVTSCIYTPGEGDIVDTGTEKIRHLRRMVLELLLARCPGVKQIRDLAVSYGADKTSIFAAPGAADNKQRCILCGRCVRVCAEVVGQHAIGYANRGGKRHIATPFETQTEACIGCGACVYVCPTRALHMEDVGGMRVMKEHHTSVPLMKCSQCSKEFATVKQVEKARRSMPIAHDKISMCPSCRRGAYRSACERAVV